MDYILKINMEKKLNVYISQVIQGVVKHFIIIIAKFG